MRSLLVFGPESSGTRLFTRVLLSAGCWGDGGHDQRLDRSFAGAGPMLVWRRSFPHFREWPDAAAMMDRLRAHGYEDVRVYWTMRDLECSVKSQLAAGHA